MVEQNKQLTRRLLDLMQETGYPVVQHNGQRKYGPPPNWVGPPPPRGTEVFVGKLPREIFEDELVPLFSKVGVVYEMRLMMDFSGSNRGYAFVTYTSKSTASRAVKELNGYEIRPNRAIGVVKSVDNCRLFVGCIPKDKTKEEIHEELSKKVSGIVDVILYQNCFDRRLNRGFAFVEFVSHRAAAMARRALVPGCVKLWDQEVTVDWAEPEPDVDDEQMNKVKVLYVRNFLIRTTPDTIQAAFESAINTKIERVKKIYDYAFIHFYQREHAEQAMRKLQNSEIDGSNVEIRWAKPVDRELYRIQKRSRGNAKFNNTFDHSQTLWLYKQHLEKQEYAKSPKEDEGFGSAYAGSLKVLYVRNFLIRTTPDTIQAAFESAINTKIEGVKKIYNYAFIHFYQREHAEQAMHKLQNSKIDGSYVEIRWGKPRDRELYRIQKRSSGNANFNNTFDHSQNLWLYKQHLEKQEYAKSPKEDEGFQLAYAGSLCGSPTSVQLPNTTLMPVKDKYTLPPAKLDSVCKRFMWTPPVYKYHKYLDPRGFQIWVGQVDLPHVGLPLVPTPTSIGPLYTGACYSLQQAHVQAAGHALTALQAMRSNTMFQQSSPTPMQPMYSSLVPSMTLPYEYMNPSTQLPPSHFLHSGDERYSF